MACNLQKDVLKSMTMDIGRLGGVSEGSVAHRAFVAAAGLHYNEISPTRITLGASCYSLGSTQTLSSTPHTMTLLSPQMMPPDTPQTPTDARHLRPTPQGPPQRGHHQHSYSHTPHKHNETHHQRSKNTAKYHTRHDHIQAALRCHCCCSIFQAPAELSAYLFTHTLT
jgi:hypothetical protein